MCSWSSPCRRLSGRAAIAKVSIGRGGPRAFCAEGALGKQLKLKQVQFKVFKSSWYTGNHERTAVAEVGASCGVMVSTAAQC